MARYLILRLLVFGGLASLSTLVLALPYVS